MTCAWAARKSKANSRKHRVKFKVKRHGKFGKIDLNKLEHKQVPKRMEPGVQKGKRPHVWMPQPLQMLCKNLYWVKWVLEKVMSWCNVLSVSLFSIIRRYANPKWDRTKFPDEILLVYHARYKCSMESIRDSVKVKVGIKVMKLVKSLIGRVWNVKRGFY